MWLKLIAQTEVISLLVLTSIKALPHRNSYLKAVTHQMRCDAPSLFPTTKQQMRHNTASLCAYQECITTQFHNIVRHIAPLWSLRHDAQKLKCFNLQRNDFKFALQRDRCVIAFNSSCRSQPPQVWLWDVILDLKKLKKFTSRKKKKTKCKCGRISFVTKNSWTKLFSQK